MNPVKMLYRLNQYRATFRLAFSSLTEEEESNEEALKKHGEPARSVCSSGPASRSVEGTTWLQWVLPDAFWALTGGPSGRLVNRISHDK